MTGQTMNHNAYLKSLETTPEPVAVRTLCQIDYTGLIKYAQQKGVLPCDLSNQEKECFVIQKL